MVVVAVQETVASGVQSVQNTSFDYLPNFTPIRLGVKTQGTYCTSSFFFFLTLSVQSKYKTVT